MSTEAKYMIVTKLDGVWVSDAVGEPNIFDSEDDAWTAIEEFRLLGEEWADGEYDVRPKLRDSLSSTGVST